jgi:NitT/TauT family transport system substrate-binding protein
VQGFHNNPSSFGDWGELEVELFGTLGEVVHDALAVFSPSNSSCHIGNNFFFVVMNRRRFINHWGAFAAMANLPCLAACTQAQSHVVAIHPWVGYETLYLAREFKWLPEAIRLHEGQSASDSFAALQSGRADAACLTLDETLRARGAGIPLSIAWVFDVSAGADMVLARPGIAQPADLAQKRLGVERNALGALVLQKLLEVAGLSESVLTLIELPPDRQLDAWRKREIDAVITYDPTATLLLREGAQRLFDSRQMPDTIFDVMAVRHDRITDRGLMHALAASHFRALEHVRTHAEDAIHRIAGREGLTVDEVRQALAGVILPSLAMNQTYLLSPDSPLLRAARTLSSLMARSGLLAQEDKLDRLILPGTLPANEK